MLKAINTAPANGYISFKGYTTSDTYSYVAFYRTNSSFSTKGVCEGTEANKWMACFLPLKEGQTVYCNYGGMNTTTNSKLIFIYAEGN